MRTLTAVEIIEFLGTSNCPNCHKFVLIHSEQSEEHVSTSTAHCDKCNKTFMVDRSYPDIPFEVLGGHEYNQSDL